jgi:hypothetical protein
MWFGQRSVTLSSTEQMACPSIESRTGEWGVTYGSKSTPLLGGGGKGG